MPNNRLTPRQGEILDFIRNQIHASGSAPTREEICAAFGFRSPYAAECHLRALARKGAIDLVNGTARGIRLPASHGTMALPLIGQVAAGAPILATEHQEGWYHIDTALFRLPPDYLLRVRGDSMRDAGIFDDDLLAVHKANDAQTGQIVVARLAEEVTVKTLRRADPLIHLLPANPAYTPIEIDLRQQELHIEGIVLGVIRSLHSAVRSYD